MARTLTTPDEVIDTLGGTGAVARLLGVDDRVVSNWRGRGLPPETYLVLTQALRSRRRSAPPGLWRMRAAAE